MMCHAGKKSTASAVLAAFWALCAVMSVDAFEPNSGYPNKITDRAKDGIITFPLLTHQHVVDRRRRELAAANQNRGLKQTEGGNSPASITAEENSLDHFQRQPMLRQSATSSRDLQAQQQVGALYQGYGTHYIDLWVGSPPQRETAIVDTGSSVTAFPCSECTDCGNHADPPFDESRSTSYRQLKCQGEGTNRDCHLGVCDASGTCIIQHDFVSDGASSSWTAFEAEDVAYAGGPHDKPIDSNQPSSGTRNPNEGENPLHASEFTFPLTFGCQTQVSGYFEKQLASGVMGMDRRAQSFWGQMRASQIIHRAQFSLCFVRQPIASTSGTTAGAVTIGGTDTRLHLTPMVFAKSIGGGSTASFKVKVRKMYMREVNGQSAMIDVSKTVHKLDVEQAFLNVGEGFNLDSGTTDTYFTSSISDEFRNLWKELAGREYTNEPVVLTDDQLRKTPTILIQMIPHEGGVGDEVQTNDPSVVPGLAGKFDIGLPNDILLEIPATHYMQHNAVDNTYTSRIYLDRPDDMGSILGANAMMGHDFLFDVDEARIGIAQSECDYARLVAESGSASTKGEDNDENNSSSESLQAPSMEEEEDEDSGNKVCGTLKCRGFVGLTLTVIFILFFIFARRYITKRDDSGAKLVSSTEYEMKPSKSSKNRDRDYADDLDDGTNGRYSDDHEDDLPGGERGGYRDKVPPPSYSDRPSRRHDNGRDGERGSRSHNSSSSRDDYSHAESYRSRDSYQSRGSRGDRSHASVHSSRSSRSNVSNQSRSSHRSSASHQSHRSAGSRDSRRSHSSHRSSESAGSRRHHDRHYSDGDRGDDRGSRRDGRYRDQYADEIPMPPSIT